MCQLRSPAYLLTMIPSSGSYSWHWIEVDHRLILNNEWLPLCVPEKCCEGGYSSWKLSKWTVMDVAQSVELPVVKSDLLCTVCSRGAAENK